MANRNAFLAVVLDGTTRAAVDRAARDLAARPSELLGMPHGTGFDPIDMDSLHMTFLFFGEHLRELPAAELRSFHTALQTELSSALEGDTPPQASLAFRGFELFPPEKMNLVVARFEATPPLLRLRDRVLGACREHGVSLPRSFFKMIEGEGAWSPHVTLGKIRATRGEVGKASCGGLGLRALSPGPARPLGLTLLGERPPRAWCDWDQAIAFGALPDVAAELPRCVAFELDGEITRAGFSSGALSAAVPEPAEWARSVLSDPGRRDQVCRSKFQQFDANQNGMLEWPECIALIADLAALLQVAAPGEARLLPAFRSCSRSGREALQEHEFERFFKGVLRAMLEHLEQVPDRDAVQPVPGRGAGVTPEDSTADGGG